MGKLCFKNLLIGLIFMCVSVAATAAILAVLSLLVKLFMPFNIIATYIAGAIVGLVCCFILKRFLLRKYNYFYAQDITDLNMGSKKGRFWIERIRDKKFIRQGAALLTYIPCLCLGIGCIVLAILIYPTLLSGYESTEDYVGYAILSSIIGGAACSWITYGILGMLSFKACKKCGAVNAFVYDETIEYDTMSVAETKSDIPSGNWRIFVKQSARSYGSKSNGANTNIMDGNARYSKRKVETFTNQIVRHCSCCSEESVIVEHSISYGKWE